MVETGPDPEQLKNLFTYSLDPLAIAADGHLLRVNSAWTDVLGWSSDELTSRPFLEIVHTADVAETREMMRRLDDGDSTTKFRNRIRHKDGTYRIVRWSLRPVDGFVYLVARDISRYADLRERAERSEAVATGIFQTAVDPMIVINTEGIIVDANRATSDMFGHSLDGLIGRNVAILMPDPYRTEHDSYINRYLADSDPRIIGIGREVEAQRADGTLFPIALAVSEVQTETDHLFTGIIHDLSERNRQRDELQAANTELESRVAERTSQLESLLEELRRSNRDLEQFAYVASHDLQAPLRNVRQGLELLDEHLEETVGANFDAEAEELRDLVIAAILRMEALIKGLLAYSRVQQSPVDEHELLDMNEVVRDVVHMLTPDVTNVGGTISVGDLPAVTGSPVQMRQVFQNLIENAIRYRAIHRTLNIGIACREADRSQVVLTVSDTGSGIEEAHHERIFELFRRGHSGYDGVGLGLAICKRIVEGHKGRMWVESSADAGATFCLQFPASIPPASALAQSR